MSTEQSKRGFFDKMLNWTEKAGNALPHPATLFGIFALLALFISALGYWLNWEVVHPGTGEPVHSINLLSKEGIHRILLEMVTNFTSFAPLGIVLVAMLGIGIAEMRRGIVINLPSPTQIWRDIRIWNAILVVGA